MSRPDLVVADRALAALAAHAAATTPGVARLQPYPFTAARAAATEAARRVGATLTGRDPGAAAPSTADPDAVDVDRRDDGRVLIGVRIVAATALPVRETAQDVARRVAEQVHELAGVAATVTVHVVDVDVDVS